MGERVKELVKQALDSNAGKRIRMTFWYELAMAIAGLSARCLKRRAQACGCPLCEVMSEVDGNVLVRVAVAVRAHAEADMRGEPTGPLPS